MGRLVVVWVGEDKDQGFEQYPARLRPGQILAYRRGMTSHGLSRVTQVRPNGYCGLPIQRTCPHANACLDCPMFVTTPDFLPQHQEHLDTTRRLIAKAQANGQFRTFEMNKRVEDNLHRIVDALQQDSDHPGNADDEGAASAS